MALVEHVAIVSLSSNVSHAEVSKVSAAIQKQVTRDFSPIWNVQATVDSYAALKDVPVGAWVVMVIDSDRRLPRNAAGVHLDERGQPFSLVRAHTGWELTTSHEVLEMLADPFGNRLVAGDSPAEGQGRVEFLVEICDPSEAEQFGYNVNGILLSDFYTPEYFDPVTAPNVRYSFTGAIKEPRVVLDGGYLSWRNPLNNLWYQWREFGGSDSGVVELGAIKFNGSLRASIERIISDQAESAMFQRKGSMTAAAVAKTRSSSEEASEANAKLMEASLRSVMQSEEIISPQADTVSLRSSAEKSLPETAWSELHEMLTELTKYVQAIKANTREADESNVKKNEPTAKALKLKRDKKK